MFWFCRPVNILWNVHKRSCHAMHKTSGADPWFWPRIRKVQFAHAQQSIRLCWLFWPVWLWHLFGVLGSRGSLSWIRYWYRYRCLPLNSKINTKWISFDLGEFWIKCNTGETKNFLHEFFEQPGIWIFHIRIKRDPPVFCKMIVAFESPCQCTVKAALTWNAKQQSPLMETNTRCGPAEAHCPEEITFFKFEAAKTVSAQSAVSVVCTCIYLKQPAKEGNLNQGKKTKAVWGVCCTDV